jgi:hypothetical protein
MCLSAPVRRGPAGKTTTSSIDCGGTFLVDWNAYASGASGGAPASFLQAPGTIVHVGLMARDPTWGTIHTTPVIEYWIDP